MPSSQNVSDESNAVSKKDGNYKSYNNVCMNFLSLDIQYT